MKKKNTIYRSKTHNIKAIRVKGNKLKDIGNFVGEIGYSISEYSYSHGSDLTLRKGEVMTISVGGPIGDICLTREDWLVIRCTDDIRIEMLAVKNKLFKKLYVNES